MKGATTIQERLWELRKDKGLNLEELSELTGISKSALGSYEKEDYKEINHGNLITLADFYEVSVDYLLCLILSRLVDTFFSRISLTMQLSPKPHNTAYVLPWEEGLHWQSRSSGCSSN